MLFSSNKTNCRNQVLLVFSVIIILVFPNAWAIEQIPITRSYTMDNVIFDGKWSFFEEWKKSSLYTLSYNDGTTIQLRLAHQGDFIYAFIDEVSKTHFTKGSDRAVICIDGNNDKNITPDNDDYCFVLSLGQSSPFVLKGGSALGATDHFNKIENVTITGVATISDQNDHYTTTPHPGYEFKIPINLFGRSDVYGFYVGIYDTISHKTYSFPEDLSTNSNSIPGPSKWGEIISPDKSIPEFPWPVLALSVSITALILLRKSILFSQYKKP